MPANRPTRRVVLQGGAAAAGSAMLAAPGLSAAPRRPNFVFIMADDLGAFDLSCYGRPDYRTPRIDSLASDGLKFGFGYSSSASCTATRVGLISGRYPNRVPVGTVSGGGAPSTTLGYEGRWPSLARTLKNAGYRTALIGKWNLGEPPNFSPRKCGYDEFFGFNAGATDYWSHDRGSPFGGQTRSPDFYENGTPVRFEGYLTDVLSQRAADFIARAGQRPFLLSLHYNAPHWPWQTRADRASRRRNDIHFDGGSLRSYADMMLALDEGVGQVLDALDRHGLTRDTVVVFTSDNGGERFSYLWPLRGSKDSLLEGGVRVPLLVRWPGRIAPGTVTGQVALSMDWLPTFAALAGAATDRAMPPDGIDLSPQLLGATEVARTVHWKTPRAQSALAFPWKYLREASGEYLFNLRDDPTENANFKLSYADEFERLKGKAAQWLQGMLPSAPAGRAVDSLRSLDGPPAPR